MLNLYYSYLYLQPLSHTLPGTHTHISLFPTLGLGAQVPSRQSGLTFNPEFSSPLPSLITRAKPPRVVRSAVLRATARRRHSPGAVEVSPGQSANLVCTPQLLPGTPLRGDRCEYFLGGLAVRPRVGARALNTANFSREQFVGWGGETGK